MKVRRQGPIVSVAGIVAIIVQDGRREVPGMDVGPSADGVPAQARQAGSARPQASGISDAHEGIKAAAAKVLNATRQRCRVEVVERVRAD
ncbi:transposase [Bradyrhizobium barranii]|uniref:transposase n=1 Tax=Bradyrhizobium barranii TaxID=2992140 RepID=UPI003D15F43C